jgi:hypothetical protein
VFKRGRTILRTDGPVGVAGDVVRHSLSQVRRSSAIAAQLRRAGHPTSNQPLGCCQLVALWQEAT